MSIDGAFAQFIEGIEDPRQAAKISYPFFDILFLTVCAVIGGAEGWEDIEDFGEVHAEWLQSKGLFPNGLPVDDTLARIVSRIKPEQFQLAFIRWMQDVSVQTEGALVAVDGKTLRHSYNRESRHSTIHMVSAFAVANRMVIGQIKTDAKSNEIKAIPELLALLDLRGCLISIDAMGCQTEIASTILNGGGDYLLAVKGNQPTLLNAVRDALASLRATPLSTETLLIERGHGRVEGREYHVLPAQTLSEQFPEWKGLATLGIALSYRIDSKKEVAMDCRYYISSAVLNQEQFTTAVRGHWAIENSLHWVLDVTMNEDASTIYRGDGAENLAGLRHMSLNMLRAETSRKASLRRKQKIAGMNTDYLDKVLTAGFNALLNK